ncbi:ABC transporter related protein [Sulfobacillus acidophilus TPY]|uniref:Teichoic-acid-transporting ATPase n=1 Tax=Sulfobacillus acidophilus (strain ATCC 700253 / DSM 10332 / NAL) TaxID=679936 RepID=G8TU56_SULAD|nr:ABC transporter related protein [Sulfobacillus acidophilus TPY]AEW05728.1 Teichoic-acid-transporting ATPase [Sulfobacillus acidophilus DSM 10332]
MASVVVDHVSKRFALRKDRADSVGQLLARMIPGRYRRPRSEPFWALKDISFEMPPGISYGIIGSNGSGKSTLLKILTRTMIPTKGRVSVNGRVSALIELGAGFHPDFTGRENVYLNASILGIPRRVVDQKMDDIIDFADIRPFIDTPVKYYSSGMHARLGFSVATSVEPEILIVDEVLAVGDEAFQQRCMDRIFRMKRQGTSILLVSHDLGSIERLMDRALWINKGEMQFDGLPHDVVRAYREALVGEQQKGGDDTPPVPEGTVTLDEARMTARDRASEVLLSGEPAILTMKFSNHGDTSIPAHVTVKFRRPDGLDIAEVSTLHDQVKLTVEASKKTRVALSVDALWLATGQYEVDVMLHSIEGRLIAEWHQATTITIQSLERGGGVMVLPHGWQVTERG